MQKPLLRSLLTWFIFLLLGVAPAAASHLIGGEMNYKYLDANGPVGAPFRYQLTALIYINSDCTPGVNQSNVPDGRGNIFVNIYDKPTGSRINSGQGAPNFTSVQTTCPTPSNQSESQPFGSFRLPRVSNPRITPPQPGGCTTPGGTSPKVRLCRYEAIVNLPVAFDGYYAVYADGTRNADIANLSNPNQQNQTIYVEMAPALLPNSSPTFSDTAVVVICQGDTSIILNNAVDPDGDRLIYSFSTPFNGTVNAPNTFTPLTVVTYATGYSATAPFGTGPGNYASLNASTGLSRYSAAMLGRYVVAVEVKEYRTINGNEVLIGSTRREVQLVARQCQPNKSPQFTSGTLATRSFTVREGQAVNFSLAATDADGNPITMRVNSVLLDGTGGYNATFAGQPGVVQPGASTGTVTINGTGGNVNGQFAFNTQCGNARLAPYDVVVTATDVTCGAKSVAEVFQITVTKAAGPTAVTGDNVICDRAVAKTYTATGPAANAYRWRVYGGAIQGLATGNTIQVLWNTVGTGRVTVRGLSAQSCLSDSTSRTIDVRPVSALAVTPAGPGVCPGGSATLTATGGQSYTWTGGGQTLTGASITVSPTQTTTYTVTATDGTCTTSRQVTVTVNPAAVANAGPAATTCSGVATQLGTVALTGYTYQWSPSTGLSSTTVAQPTLTLINTTGTPQQLTYTVTATSGPGCSATSSVQVTVNPAAVANAGPDVATCSSVAAQLGTEALTGYTYQWSPATGLSSSTVAQPILTFANTTGTPQQLTYTVTATSALGCVATSTVRVMLNAASVAQAGADRAVCSGEKTTLGTASLTGYTYQWSPATGLSSSTVAQPVFSALNTGTTPQVLTYTLTATTANGCVSTSTVRVTVNPAAVADAGPDAASCADKKVTLGTPALTGYAYQWSPAANLSSATAARPVLTAVNTTANPLTLSYVVIATNAQQCVGRDTVRVTVNPRPAADSINGTASVCPTVQGVTYSIRNPRSAAYQWIVRGGTIASGQGTTSITVNWGTTSASASVQAFTLNTFSCSSDTVALPVRINQLLATAKPTGPLSVCQADGPYTYQTLFTKGSLYAWQIVGGMQVGTNQASVQVRWTRPGTGKIVVTETSSPSSAIQCLGHSDTLYVKVLPSPLATLAISGPARACANGGNISFTLPGAATSTYQFTLNGAPITSTGNTATFAPPAAGTYTLTARETNTSACAGPIYTRQFIIDPTPAAVTITGPRNVCPEGLTGLRYSVAGLTGSTFQWTVTGGTLVSGQGTTDVVVNFTAATGAKAVNVTETSGFGCSGAANTLPANFDNVSLSLQLVSVDQQSDTKINLNLAAASNTSNGNRVNILRRDAGSTGAYQNVGNVPNTATTFADTGVDADARAYQYRLELTNACGTVLNSTEHTTIRLEATATQSKGGRDEGKVTLRWNPYKGLTVREYAIYRRADKGTEELVQTVPATSAAQYAVELTTGAQGFNQCFRVRAVSAQSNLSPSQSNEACVDFKNPLAFYNIITPDGDGLNDVVYIDNVQLYPGNTFTVFSRWGKEIYSTSNYHNTWGGEGAAAGVYYYVFKLPAGTTRKGWFEIVK